MIKIAVIAGSTRPGRFGIQPATWVADMAKQRSDISVDFIDLKEVNLPFLDEPIPPSQNQYSQDHTKLWSERIDGADGFIFVTSEYNHSYPAALKNAIDFLFHEWHYKPVSFVSYGSAAGGARAVEHLRGVAGEIKLYDLREQLLLPNYWEEVDENGQYQFTERHEKSINRILDDLVFWAKTLQEARAKLSAHAGE